MYHVVEIMDDCTLLINYGFENGAKRGQLLRIYTPGEEIIDPITGTSLGTLDIIKAEVEITTAYSLFSICRRNAFNAPINSPLANFVQQIVKDKLPVDPNNISNRTLPEPTLIQVGDPVMVISK